METIENLSCGCNKYRSASINELASAMSKAQSAYARIDLNRENPYFKSKYADLDSIVEATRSGLSKNGIFFTQTIHLDDGATILHTELLHSSGQWIKSMTRILPAKNDPQTYGSTLTFMKRYAAAAILGVTASHDPLDDDAEVAMVEARQILSKGPSNKYNPKEQSADVVTREQLDELEYELSEYPDLADEIMTKMQIQSLADLPKIKYAISMKRIREIKAARNGVK